MIEPKYLYSPTMSASSPLITSGRGVLRLGNFEKEVVVIAPAHKLVHGTAVELWVTLHCNS